MFIRMVKERRSRTLSQKARLAAALVYTVLLLFLARYLNGSFLPPYGLHGLWFYSAAAALLIGQLLVEPFFTRPAEALANGIAIVIASVTVALDTAEIDLGVARTGRVL